MTQSSTMRVVPSADGVSIWSRDIFGNQDQTRLRDFLSRTFSVPEVDRVELQRAAAFGRIHYGPRANPAQLWKKLGSALSSGNGARAFDTAALHLDSPDALQVTRLGDSLTTWRVRYAGDHTLLLSHPALRNRRDLVFRLEEELAAIFGIRHFRASALTAGVTIRYDKSAVSLERLAKELERAWPRVLAGLDGPPSRTRLATAVGLAGLAFTGQYIVPAVRPFAVAGMAVYSSPNLLKAAKELKRGEVGVSAMYSTGLALMLVSGMPFTAAVMATFMQLWPQLAHRTVVRSQRRIFAAQRRRPAWARVPQDSGVELEVSVEDLRKDDLIVVRRGDVVPVDGVVEDGYAAIIAGATVGAEHVEETSRGDAIAAGAFVRDGTLIIRVERAGSATAASYVASLLPHAHIPGLPSELEVERIANRNAKGALALAAAGFSATRTLRAAQIAIRPDYVTGPRLSAQLSAFRAVAQAAQRGVLFKNPAALDRLASIRTYVFDDSSGLERRTVEVDTVKTAQGVSPALVLGYALVAHRRSRSEQARALARGLGRYVKRVRAQIAQLHHEAGLTRFRDRRGDTIEIASARYLEAAKIKAPQDLWRSSSFGSDHSPGLRPLAVLRNGEVIGAVSFARRGEPIGKQLIAAIRQHDKHAKFVYVSRRADSETRSLAHKLGIETAHGGLDHAAKLELIRGLGAHTLWVGDGSDANAPIAASTVSVSIAALSRVREDAADILVPDRGIDRLLELLQIGREHARRRSRDYGLVYTANLIGLGGGALPRFSALHAGLISNLGTGLVYAQHAWGLGRLASTSERNRARLHRTHP